MPKIEPDPDSRASLLHELRRMLGGRREGKHLSDLLFCMRKTFFDILDPLPRTDRELLLFAAGIAHGELFEAAEKAFGYKSQHTVVRPVFGGSLIHTLDAILGDRVDEIKTTRKGRGRMTRGEQVKLEMPWALEQHGGYMIAVQVERSDFPKESKGRLIVFHLIEPDLAVWSVTWSPEEMRELKAMLDSRSSQLDAYVAAKRPPPGPRYPWECGGCRYSPRCLSAGLITKTMAEGRKGKGNVPVATP